MIITEILIAVLLGLLVIVTSAYLVYFCNISNKKLKERYDNGDCYDEPRTKNKILSICLLTYLVFSIFTLSTNIVYKSGPIVNNQYYVSVNTTSMSAPLSSNTYLSKNNLKNQIKQYDVAVCNVYENQSLNLYDVILFKKENKRIIHRIIKINEDNTYITQGDNNYSQDDFVVHQDEILGIYVHSLKFMSFINYLGHTPGFYVLFIGITFDIGALLYFEINREKIKKIKE